MKNDNAQGIFNKFLHYQDFALTALPATCVLKDTTVLNFRREISNYDFEINHLEISGLSEVVVIGYGSGKFKNLRSLPAVQTGCNSVDQ